jgi:diaminopropionate ammonia-lyase
MRLLAQSGITSGESGAAGLAGMIELLTTPGAAHARAALGITPAATLLLLNTEGATDPESYRRIIENEGG